jgi:hypothetical protein
MTTRKFEEDSAPATVVEEMHRAVARHGPRRVIKAIGLSEAAFWRAYSGVKVRAGTVHQIRAGLAGLDVERAG